ncbi:inositol monophosphatase family protein [Streptomyces sp. NPDC102409]|uniref:inositol monophosphatase family protein n=1 Tax=Streptomyces sp. NPDC102409 TaxID=3366172 RepID=UPI00380100AE
MSHRYTHTEDMEVATAAALAGARVVREMYGRRLTRIDKGGGDFATGADVAAERAILDVIRSARPDDAVLGEEGGQLGADGSARQWLVDPLCGTRNYAVGTMLVAVNVALSGGAAAVADPFSGELFRTDGESPAYVSDGADLSGDLHFAAGIALCRAAGCVVTGVDGVPVGQGGRGLVAAADDETHRLLMALVAHA